MKKLKIPLLCVLLILSLTAVAWAEEAQLMATFRSGECGATEDDHVTWTLDDAGTLTISGSGEMTEDYDPWDSYTSKIKSVVIENGVSFIRPYAFSNLSRLNSVVVASSVGEITEGMFYGCTALDSVTIENGISSIGESAFSGCSRLVHVALPDSVTHIESSAFSGCKKLETISFGKGLTFIGNEAFSGCEKLNNVTIPGSVEHIGDLAFYNCYKLSNILIPDGVTHLGRFIFGNCYDLRNATIGKGISSVTYDIFDSCKKLDSLIVPETIEVIGALGSWDDYSMPDVYYAGASVQWDAVSGEGKEYLDEYAASIHYNSTGPDNPGTVKPLTFELSSPSFGVSVPLDVTGGGTRTANFFAAFYNDDNKFIGANGTQAIISPRLQSVFVPVSQKFTPVLRVFALDDDFKPLSPGNESWEDDDELPEKYVAILEEPDEDARNTLIGKLTATEARDFVKQFMNWIYD